LSQVDAVQRSGSEAAEDVVHSGLGEAGELRYLGLGCALLDCFDDQLVASVLPLLALAGRGDEAAGEVSVDH
jgi:hypothetical protein